METNFRGPTNSMGSLEVQSGTAATVEPFDGPSGSYQGVALLDIRGAPFNKDSQLPGAQPAFIGSQSPYTVDNKPQAAATTVIAAAQTAGTSGVAVALATTGVAGANAGNPSIAVGVPIVPMGTSVVTSAIALDFGFATGTTVAGSSTVVVNDSTLFTASQWTVIGSVGNAALQTSLLTQVQSIANATTITVLPAPLGSLTNAPIGQANLYGANFLPPATQFGPGTSTPTAHNPNMQAGFLRVHNPRESLARNISVSLVTGGVATAVGFLVSGWDVWRQPMTELISVPATAVAVTIYGKKAFKYLNNVVPQSNGTTNSYSVGLGDVFGLPIRADEWEQCSVFWNGCFVPTSLGFTVATTAAATNTTGDVRGTIQVSTNGGGSAPTIGTASVSNGTARLCIVQNPGVWNTIFATPLNTVPMFGVTNSTT